MSFFCPCGKGITCTNASTQNMLPAMSPIIARGLYKLSDTEPVTTAGSASCSKKKEQRCKRIVNMRLSLGSVVEENREEKSLADTSSGTKGENVSIGCEASPLAASQQNISISPIYSNNAPI